VSSAKKISDFSFFSMTASLFVTVYEYPTFADYGKTAVFFLVICGLLWFLPLSLCSAELASIKGAQQGGIFSWVGVPLGNSNGFSAIFFQWFQITVGFVTMIYFIIGTVAYIFKIPSINNDPTYKFFAVIGIFWILTLLQFKGTKITTSIAKYGFSIGIILPVCIMIVMVSVYLLHGNPVSNNFSGHSFIPNAADIPALSTFLLAYMGVEASATHISELNDSKKSYPRILGILVIIGIATSAIGGSVVSIVLHGKISANEGVMDAVQELISPNRVSLPVVVIGLLIIFGISAQVSSWIVSPTEGLQYVAQKGLLNRKFAKKNREQIPINILVVQGIIVTIWAAILTFGSGSAGGSLSFQIAISLTVLIYLSAYILLFAAYLRVGLYSDNVETTYEVKGGKVVKAIVGSAGLVISLVAIATTFIPPKNIQTSEGGTYILILAISYLVVLLVPYAIYFYEQKNIKA